MLEIDSTAPLQIGGNLGGKLRPMNSNSRETSSVLEAAVANIQLLATTTVHSFQEYVLPDSGIPIDLFVLDLPCFLGP